MRNKRKIHPKDLVDFIMTMAYGQPLYLYHTSFYKWKWLENILISESLCQTIFQDVSYKSSNSHMMNNIHTKWMLQLISSICKQLGFCTCWRDCNGAIMMKKSSCRKKSFRNIFSIYSSFKCMTCQKKNVKY